LIGGGGGGSLGGENDGGSGGGSGAYVFGTDISIVAGAILNFTLGSGGSPNSSGGNTTLIFTVPVGNLTETYTIYAGGGGSPSGAVAEYDINGLSDTFGYEGNPGSDADGGSAGGSGGVPYYQEVSGKGLGGNGGDAGDGIQTGQPGQPGYWEFRLSTEQLDIAENEANDD
jgi:hypothetical protein